MASRTAAGLQALLVTFLWSTSFIITKWIFAAGGIGPLWLNALRYGIAAALLLGYRQFTRRRPLREVFGSGYRLFLPVVLLGLANYALTQGGLTLGLAYLPSTHVALILNLNNTLQVLIFSALLLRELPLSVQWTGLGLGLVGAAAFYYPLASPPGGWLGALPVIVCGVGYGLTTVYTRKFMRAGVLSALDLTVVSMAAGSLGMALLAFALEGLPRITAVTGGYLLWMSLVNTAFTFTLWAHTQKVLAPFETSTLNNTMLVQIALMSWLFLGEPLTGLKLAAIVVVSAATLLVQVGPRWLGGATHKL